MQLCSSGGICFHETDKGATATNETETERSKALRNFDQDWLDATIINKNYLNYN